MLLYPARLRKELMNPPNGRKFPLKGFLEGFCRPIRRALTPFGPFELQPSLDVARGRDEKVSESRLPPPSSLTSQIGFRSCPDPRAFSSWSFSANIGRIVCVPRRSRRVKRYCIRRVERGALCEPRRQIGIGQERPTKCNCIGFAEAEGL
jgi:hypothetical protein